MVAAAAALVFALASPVPFQAADPADASAGVRAFNTGDYKGAAASLAREVQASPDDLGLRITYAVALLQIKDYQTAAAQLDRAVALAPSASILRDLHVSTSARTRATKAGTAATMKPLAGAVVTPGPGQSKDSSVAALRQAAIEHPASAAAASLLGDAYQLSGKLSEAEQWYRKAMALAPEWTKPAVGLALTALDTDPTRSANLLEDVLRRDPSNSQARLWLGDAYRRTGRQDLADRCYLQAAEDPLTRADALVRRGTQYMGQNQVLKAEEQFSRAQAVDPDNLPAVVGMAQTQSLRNDFGEAQKTAGSAADKSKALSPATQAKVYLNAAQVAQAAGNYDDAGHYIGTANRLAPDDQSIYAQEAGLYARQDSLRGWIAEQESALKQKPGDLTAMRRLAEGYRAAGDHVRRLEILDRLTEAGAAGAWQWKLQSAESLWALGRKDDACERWLSAVDAGYPTRTIRIAESIGSRADASSYVTSRFSVRKSSRNAGHLLYAIASREGRYAEALAHLDRVIALDPKNVTLMGQRGWLLGKMGRSAEAEKAFHKQRDLIRQKQ